MRVIFFCLLIFSSPAHASTLPDVLSKEDARQLAELVQLPGLDRFIGDQAKAVLIEKIGNKVIAWMAEAVKGKTDPRTPFQNNPEISKQVKAELQKKLQAWLPGEVRQILKDNFFQDEVAAEIISELNKSFNEQADQLLGNWYERMMSRGLDVHLADKIGDLIGQSTVRGLQNNIIKGLRGELPEEAMKYLRMGPDKFAEYVEKGRQFLPSAQFKKLKNRVMGIHIVDLPNQAYGGILAASAAMHFAKFASSCAGFFATCDWHELKRGKEVTQTMLWQLKNKKYVSLTLGDFTVLIKKLGDQLGTFNFRALKQMAKWNPANLFLKKLDAIEAKLKELDKIYDQATGKILEGMNKPIAALQTKLKELSDEMLRPFTSPIQCLGILAEGCPDALPKISDITKWEGLKKTLGLEEGLFGKAGDKTPLDPLKKLGDAFNQEVSKTLAGAAVKITDALRITGPLAEILGIEKIPPKNASKDSDFEPVFLHNGEFYYTATDVTLPCCPVLPSDRYLPSERSEREGEAPMALPLEGATRAPTIDFQFTRIYRSRSEFLGVLGFQWTHNYAQRLLFWEGPSTGLRTGSEEPGLTYIDGEGKKWFFKQTDLFFEPPAGLDVDLQKSKEGYVLKREGLDHFFDANGFLKSIANQEGDSLTLFYNDSDQLTQIIDTQGRLIHFHYRPDGLLERLEDHTGRTWRFEYNDQYALIATTTPGTPDFPKGKTTRYRYDNHKMTMVMDPKGQIYLENFYAEFGKDAGKILAQKYGTGDLIEARYDGLNTWVSDRRGVMHLYEHNEEGEIIKNAGPANFPSFVRRGEAMRYEYDSWGNIIAIHDEQDRAHRFEVDATNLITKEIVNGEERFYKYDANDNIIQIDVPSQNLGLEFEYDILDRLIVKKEILDGSHTIITRYEYDPQGRLTRFVYPLGNDVRFVYDEEGNLVQRIRGEGTLERSVETSRVSSRAPQGRGDPVATSGLLRHYAPRNDTSVAYDPIGRPLQINDTRLEWDDNSRLASLTDEKGQSTRYFYDSLNRLVVEKFPDGTEKSYAHDPADRLTGMIDRDGTPQILKYDDQGHLISRESINFRQEFYYDEAGSLTLAIDYNDLKDPSDDIRVELATDDQGRLAGEKIHGHWVYKSFDPLNQKTGITYPSGLQVIRQFEEGRLVNLFAEDQPLTLPSFEDKDTEIFPSPLARPERSRRVGEGRERGTRREASGNLLEEDDFAYAYDSLHRLTATRNKKTGEEIRFKYDAFGRIARKEKSKEKIDYFHDEFNLIAAYSDEGTKRYYIYSSDLDRPAAFFKNKELYFYHLDRFGSVREITSAKGEVIEQYDYLPFGEMTISKTGETGNELGFIGRPFDFEGRLVNLRYRFYSPPLHAFLTADPLGYKNDFHSASAVWTPRNLSYHQGQGGASRATFPNHIVTSAKTHLLDIDLFSRRENIPPAIPETDLFAYAGGDPLHFVDPLGLYKIDIQFLPLIPTGREAFLAHTNGKRKKISTPYGDNLSPTLGCIRMRNNDLGKLVEEIHTLREADIKEFSLESRLKIGD